MSVECAGGGGSPLYNGVLNIEAYTNLTRIVQLDLALPSLKRTRALLIMPEVSELRNKWHQRAGSTGNR